MSYLRTIPLRFWFLIIISYVLPLFVPEPAQEMLWFVYLVPAFFFAYYGGLRGGILAAIVSFIILAVVECAEYLKGDFAYWEIYWHSVVVLVILFVTIGVGFLAEQLKRQQRDFEEMALKDPLTNLYNRRYLYQRLEEEVSKFQRYKKPFSILMIDVDDFKPYNDSFGHLAGDDLLVCLASIMTKDIRPYDVLCRWGGEEFVILYPDTDRADATVAAERLRESVMTYGFDHRQVTVSIGVATYDKSEMTIDQLINKADKALYQAKGEKNKVILHTSS